MLRIQKSASADANAMTSEFQIGFLEGNVGVVNAPAGFLQYLFDATGDKKGAGFAVCVLLIDRQRIRIRCTKALMVIQDIARSCNDVIFWVFGKCA